MGPQAEDETMGFGPHPMQQPLPVDFTTADSLQLQKLNSGLSLVDQQFMDGELEPHHADDLRQQIMTRKIPLLERQKASTEAAREAQVHQLMQDSAQAQGISQMDAMYRARGLKDRVVPVMHPKTGQTAFLYEQEPNKFAQIAFDNPMEAPNDVPGGVTGYGGSETPGPAQTEGSPASAERPTESPDSVGPMTPPPPPAPRVADVGGDGHTMEIWNGANKELVHFNRAGQITGRHAFDASGNEVAPQGPPPTNEDVLTPHEMEFARHLAEQSVAPVPHPPDNSLASQVQFAKNVAARNLQVARTTQGIVNRQLAEKAAKQHQAWRAGENEAQNQRMVSRQKQHEQTAKDEKARADEDKKTRETFQKRLEHHVDSLAKEDAWKGRSHKDRVEEAKSRMEAEGYEVPGQKAQAEEAHKAAAPIMEKAQAAGDAEGVAAGHALGQIIAKYGKIDKAPPEVQQQAKALLARVQRYMGEPVKPVGPAPAKMGEMTPKSSPAASGMPGQFGYGGPV